MKLVIATKNMNKFKEIEKKFHEIKGLELLPLSSFENSPDVEETGKTFEENAFIKARAISRFTNLPVMSDDSGLMVKALHGRPGIYSARFGGENTSDNEKNMLILKEMNNITENRDAKFVCSIALVFPDGESEIVTEECKGVIAENVKGDEGFGYDPIFFIPEYGKTMAEISMEKKNEISHRAKALEKIKEKILNRIGNN